MRITVVKIVDEPNYNGRETYPVATLKIGPFWSNMGGGAPLMRKVRLSELPEGTKVGDELLLVGKGQTLRRVKENVWEGETPCGRADFYVERLQPGEVGYDPEKPYHCVVFDAALKVGGESDPFLNWLECSSLEECVTAAAEYAEEYFNGREVTVGGEQKV